MRNIRCLPGLLLCALLFCALHGRAEERYMRYRLLDPQTPSIAALLSHSHIYAECSWAGLPLPGFVSNHDLYNAPGVWSPWVALPASPMWGDIRMDMRGADPITACKVEIQVAARPDENAVARTFTVATATGNRVGFNLPPGIVKDPDLIETFPEDFARRRRVAAGVAVPEKLRPKLLRFSPCSVSGEPSVAGSADFERETARMLGLNCIGDAKSPGAAYFSVTDYRATLDWAAKLEIPAALQPRCATVGLADEPSWYEGVEYFLAKDGANGFNRFLRDNGVTLEALGVKSWDEVTFLRRNAPVPADAPLALRRRWFWSCRYTMTCHSRYWALITAKVREKFPSAPTSINYTDHYAGILTGALGQAPDIFEDGRQNAVTMHWSEDWIAPCIDCWGDGMYQKVAYLADLLRGGGRYQGFTPTRMGFHVIGNGWNPKGTGTDAIVGLRVLLLLQQGCKTFSYFNYGPTLNCTVDFWADDANFVRGVADTAKLVGGEKVEPYLWEGMPVRPQTCLVYSVENFYWLESNKVQEDEFERQWLYCMLQQGQIPVDIIAGADLQRFIGDYKAAYVVDRNLVAVSAAALMKWVEAGGVLTLDPRAATFDEVNEPLRVFPAEPGSHRVGKGWVVRLKEREGKLWREAGVALNRANPAAAIGTLYWYADYDRPHRDAVCRPALELAKVARPVAVDAAGVIAEPLVSARGIAVPLVNLRAMFPTGATKYKAVKVTLADGKTVKRAWSSRRGPLPLQRRGAAVTVTLPLDCTDVVIFAR